MEENKLECPVATAVSLFGTKWKAQIIRDLIESKNTSIRFSEFKNTIPNISDRMLSQSLKELEKDQLIKRTLVDASPPRAEYSLTEMGENLSKVLLDLYNWGKEYQDRYMKEGDVENE
ncbi:MAG: winged helix-turn-helix transcriptional regulator [Fusobacterium ulcerans]|uniref:winged helix-turn-helix transcriptional regulator n=1 Tax=Fusobacterium ulcerans TaxID=861 RepID=UPI003A88DF08